MLTYFLASVSSTAFILVRLELVRRTSYSTCQEKKHVINMDALIQIIRITCFSLLEIRSHNFSLSTLHIHTSTFVHTYSSAFRFKCLGHFVYKPPPQSRSIRTCKRSTLGDTPIRLVKSQANRPVINRERRFTPPNYD